VSKRQKKVNLTVEEYAKMPYLQLERLLNVRQRKFVALVASGISGTAAAEQAGYSKNTAASQASALLKQPKVIAYRRGFARLMYEAVCLTPEAIGLKLYRLYELCMTEVPLMEWDSGEKTYVEIGKKPLDIRNAIRVLQLLGKNVGMFEERVEITGSIDGLEEYVRDKK